MSIPFMPERKHGTGPDNSRFIRVVSFIIGLVAFPISSFLALLFISNEYQEAQSAAQWGVRHPYFLFTITTAFAIALVSL